MSVIVKGMEMPESCWLCELSDIGICELKGKRWDPDPGQPRRPDWCPLHSLPEKHGRLIDADDMERFMSDTVQGDIRQYPYSDTLWDMAFKWIDSRPTIVEAEGE